MYVCIYIYIYTYVTLYIVNQSTSTSQWMHTRRTHIYAYRIMAYINMLDHAYACDLVTAAFR